MQIQTINNQPSFNGKLNIISVNITPLFNDVKHDVFKTTKFQDLQIRRTTDQMARKFDPEHPVTQFIAEKQADRFVKLIESITGLSLMASPTQRKFLVNKPNTIIFSDESPKNGGLAIRFDADLF